MKCLNCGNDVEESSAFCTNCGSQIGELKCPKCGENITTDQLFCTECGFNLKSDNGEYIGNNVSVLEKVDSNIDSLKKGSVFKMIDNNIDTLRSGSVFKRIGEDHSKINENILKDYGFNKNQRKKFIKFMTSQGLSYYRDSITPNLIDEFLDIDSNKQEFLRHSKKLEEKRIKEKIEEVTAETLIESDYFKSRKQKFNVKEGHFYYKQILNEELKNGHLGYDDVESRLDELLQINDAQSIYELRTNKPTHLFKTRRDLDQYIGYGTAKNPIPISDEEMDKFYEKLESSGSESSLTLQKILSEELDKKAVEEIKETKKVSISIPNGKKLLNSPLAGALAGDVIAGGAGRMIGGLAGAGDILGSTMGAMGGGLILGGAGALIGGLIAATDDGIEWFDTVLVLTEDEALIAGKIVLPYRNIKHVHAEKGKGFDVVTLTMNQGGLQFKTSNGVALKEVMDEMIEESKEKVLISSNSENSPQEKLHTDLEQQEPVKIEKSPFEKIKEAKELLDMGALTQDEFDEIKRKALDMLR